MPLYIFSRAREKNIKKGRRNGASTIPPPMYDLFYRLISGHYSVFSFVLILRHVRGWGVGVCKFGNQIFHHVGPGGDISCQYLNSVRCAHYIPCRWCPRATRIPWRGNHFVHARMFPRERPVRPTETDAPHRALVGVKPYTLWRHRLHRRTRQGRARTAHSRVLISKDATPTSFFIDPFFGV